MGGKSLLSLVLGIVILSLAAFSFVSGAILGGVLSYSGYLPKIPELKRYQPKTVSTFYAEDGTVIGVFYKQKRFVVELNRIPVHVVHAFMAAEDSRFYQHRGVDWMGMVRAAYTNLVTGRFQQGASTITQQLTRHVLLSHDKKISRKIKEILLAKRLEKLWGKEKILYVYLNEIYLGGQCYGVEAAARNYFDKHVEQLTTAEAALLAGIVPSPATYNPFKNEGKAVRKQKLVLKNMLQAEFISSREYERALREKLHLHKDTHKPFDLVPDFSEAVRRYVIRKYGAIRLYNEGLKVYTTCRLEDQRHAFEAVSKGVKELNGRRKTPAVVRIIDAKDFSQFLRGRADPLLKTGTEYQGLITRIGHMKTQTVLHVALSHRVHGEVRLPRRSTRHRVGHLLAIGFSGYERNVPLFELAADPPVQAALVCIENGTGYVRALVGGSSKDRFQFNRSMQARRQPGSSFKPIIYAAAIDQYSYTPATVIVDEPVVIEIDGTGEEWSPSNADGEFVGPISMRQALELSRNVCTIKILMDVSPGSVMALARRMGIKSKLEPNLSLALGTSELTLFELTSAYTVFPNRGLFVAPVLVKRIEDRYGNILEDNTKISRLNQALIPSPIPRSRSDPFTHKISSLIEGAREKIGEKECPSPDDPAPDWPTLKPGSKKSEASQPPKSKARLPYPGTCPPAPPRLERPAMSPETAYIMTSLLQGVVTSGTGARLGKYLKRRDLCGKTGTTDNSQDAWFIGYNPNYTTGVWVGFDDNRPLGEKETGSMAALPIWGYFMKNLLEGIPEKRYPIPKKIVRRKMPTITHQKGVGVASSTVIEPVYEPLSKKTLSLSPIDRPEAIAAMLQTPGGQNQIERGTPTNAAYVPGPQGGNRGLYRGAQEAVRAGPQGSPPQNGIKAWPSRPKSRQPTQPQPMYLNPVYRPPGKHVQ